jgi:hypothetical protein
MINSVEVNVYFREVYAAQLLSAFHPPGISCVFIDSKLSLCSVASCLELLVSSRSSLYTEVVVSRILNPNGRPTYEARHSNENLVTSPRLWLVQSPNNLRTLLNTLSLSGSYGWSLLGISRTAGKKKGLRRYLKIRRQNNGGQMYMHVHTWLKHIVLYAAE